MQNLNKEKEVCQIYVISHCRSLHAFSSLFFRSRPFWLMALLPSSHLPENFQSTNFFTRSTLSAEKISRLDDLFGLIIPLLNSSGENYPAATFKANAPGVLPPSALMSHLQFQIDFHYRSFRLIAERFQQPG